MRADVVRLADYVDGDHAVELTQELGTIPSFSGDEAVAARFLAERFRELSFDEVVLQDAEPGRPNVIGLLRGSGGGPTLMLNGHLDVSPVPMDFPADPFRPVLRDGRLYGHGIRNMKSGVAAMVEAAAALRRARVRLRGDIIVAAVVGELQGGIGTVALLEAGYRPQVAIVPEPTLLSIRTTQCGALDVLVHVRGTSIASASRHLTAPVSALEQMIRVIPAIESMTFAHTPHPAMPHLPLVSIGGIIGGVGGRYAMPRFEYSPDLCTITVAVRTVPGQTLESVRADFERTLAPLRAADPRLQLEVAMPPAAYAPPFGGLKYFVPSPDVPVDAPVVGALAEAHEQITGQPPPRIGALIPNSYFYCDAGHLNHAGADAVSYGPAGAASNSLHARNVRIDDLLTCARSIALAAYRLCA